MNEPLPLFSGAPFSGGQQARTAIPEGQPGQTDFFALRPDAVDAERVTREAVECVRRAGLTVRPTDVARLHVTLEFVGDGLDARALSAACLAADSVSLPAFDIVFDRALTFGTSHRHFVLTGKAGVEPVRHLRTTLAQALADQGFNPGLSYRPHMTLCYGLRREVAEHAITPLSFRARAFHLIRSHVGLSRHELLASWPLASGA